MLLFAFPPLLMTVSFASSSGLPRSSAPVAISSQDDWPALPSPARPVSARAAVSNTPPVYSSPFPADDAASRGRGKKSPKRGSGSRGGRNGGRASAGSSHMESADVTGVAAHPEGLGPDAPTQRISTGEPSRGT